MSKLQPHCISGTTPYQHDGQEFIYILKGSIEFVLLSEDSSKNTYFMHESECMYFDSNAKHSFINNSDEIAEVLCVSSPPYF